MARPSFSMSADGHLRATTTVRQRIGKDELIAGVVYAFDNEDPVFAVPLIERMTKAMTWETAREMFLQLGRSFAFSMLGENTHEAIVRAAEKRIEHLWRELR